MEGEAAKAIRSYQCLSDSEQNLGHGQAEKPAPKANFLYQILGSDLPEREKSKQRMGQEAFSIIAAGGETVGRTLSLATYHLLSNPAILERLRNELTEAHPNLRVPLAVTKLEHLPFLVSYHRSI